MQKTIGFIGLGIMGTPMVRKLSEKFPGVRVFDVDASKVKALKSGPNPAAIEPAESIAEISRTCDLVLLSLPNSVIVRQVTLGESGISSKMKAGGTVIDLSTTDTSVVTEIASALKKCGIDFLDAPLSGGEKAAIEGTLSVMVGGDEKVFETCLPYLSAIGTSVVRIGGTGSGQVAKCVNQMIVGAAFAAATEAFALGAKNGIDTKTLYDAIKGGWAGSKVLDVVAKDLLSREFKPGGTIEMILKDLGYVMALTKSCDFPAPLTALVHELFKAGKAAGDGKYSQTAIIKLWEQVLKIEVR